MEAISFDKWLDDNIDEDNPNEMRDLYVAIRDGVSTGDVWSAHWDGKMLVITGGKTLLPLHSKSSRDCILHMMEQRYGNDSGESGFFIWIDEALKGYESQMKQSSGAKPYSPGTAPLQRSANKLPCC